MCVVVGHNGPQHRNLVGHPGSQRHQFADAHSGRSAPNRSERTAYFDRCVRLGIPSVMLPRTAEQPEDDDGFCFPRTRGWRRLSLPLDELGQREAAEADRSDPHPLAAGESIASIESGSDELKHCVETGEFEAGRLAG